MPLSAVIKSSVAITQTGVGDVESATSQVNESSALTYSDGSGAGQANVQWSDDRTIAASGSENLDLAGSLANLLGTAVFARVKYIKIVANANNTNKVTFSQPASNGLAGIFLAAGDGVSIPPGGKFEWGDPGATGVAVTAGTGDLLTVANSGGGTSVTYRIIIIGASS